MGVCSSTDHAPVMECLDYLPFRKLHVVNAGHTSAEFLEKPRNVFISNLALIEILHKKDSLLASRKGFCARKF
jgi:hypothetical protein